MKLHLLLVVIGSITICTSSQTSTLVKDYLKVNNLKIALLITCGNQNNVNSIETLFTLRQQEIWINVLDISNEIRLSYLDYGNFFIRTSNAHCVVVDLDCNQTSAFMTEMSDRMLFHYERNWLIFSSSFNKSVDILSQQNINVDAKVSLVIPVATEKDNHNYDIYGVYNPSSKHGGRLNVTRLGDWNKSTGLNIPLKQTKIERRHNFHGMTFTSVITVKKTKRKNIYSSKAVAENFFQLRNVPENVSYLEHLRSNDFVYLNSASRINYHLFALVMDIHNFNIFLRVAKIWASLDSSGNWHGAIELVNRSEVDFCLTPLRWENDRYGLIEHTTHSYHVQALFVFRHPKSIPSNTFLLPFKSTLWFSIFGLALISAYIVRHIFSVENRNLKDGLMNEDSYSNSALMVFGFILQQNEIHNSFAVEFKLNFTHAGYYGHPCLTSSRILTIAVLTFSLLIYQFYSSFIVGSLLVETPKNIKTMKQLLNSKLSFGLDETPYVIDIFNYTKEESTVQLYEKIMKHPEHSIMSVHAGLDLLKKGGFAFNTDGSYAYNILKEMLSDSEKCELQDIVYAPKISAGPVLPNKSAFRELIKIGIRRITETGLLSYFNKIFYGTRPKCEISEVIVSPVDIFHFSSALYILIAGIVCSTTLLTLEILVEKHSKNKKISKL